MRLACWFRRHAETNFLAAFIAGLIEYVREVRDGEDTIASTRDARAPQNWSWRKNIDNSARC